MSMTSDEDAMCWCGHRQYRHTDEGDCAVDSCECDDFELYDNDVVEP